MTAFEVMEQAGWSADDWNQLDADIRAVVKATAKVRNVLPAGPAPTNPYQVFVPTISNANGSLVMDTSKSVVPVRLSCRLTVASNQVGDRAVVGALAKRAAHAVAGLEDLVLAFGDLLPKTIGNSSAVECVGLENVEGLARAMLSVPGANPDAGKDATPIADKDVLVAVKEAIAELQSNGHFGPYVALMLPKMWNEASKDLLLPISTHHALRIALGDDGELIPLRTIDTADDNRGIVISTGSGAFDFVEVAPASIALVGYTDGNLELRVEERFVLRVLDDTAVRDILETGSSKTKRHETAEPAERSQPIRSVNLAKPGRPKKK